VILVIKNLKISHQYDLHMIPGKSLLICVPNGKLYNIENIKKLINQQIHPFYEHAHISLTEIILQFKKLK
jgi:hypothetical protein